jgi:hypothetical protein
MSLSSFSLSRRAASVGLALAASGLVLTACVAETVGPPRYRETVVGIAPPAPEVEVVGVAPHPGWVWQPGYWNWEANRHVWVAGNWVAPRPGYHWEPHAWVHEDKGWRLREGYWARG